jgi:hypothetical protein
MRARDVGRRTTNQEVLFGEHWWHCNVHFPDGRIASVCILAESYGSAGLKLKTLYTDATLGEITKRGESANSYKSR